jgi:hypothetical protein
MGGNPSGPGGPGSNPPTPPGQDPGITIPLNLDPTSYHFKSTGDIGCGMAAQVEYWFAVSKNPMPFWNFDSYLHFKCGGTCINEYWIVSPAQATLCSPFQVAMAGREDGFNNHPDGCCAPGCNQGSAIFNWSITL